jgi:hypothetical protein
MKKIFYLLLTPFLISCSTNYEFNSMRSMTLNAYSEEYIQLYSEDDISCTVTVNKKEIDLTAYSGDVLLIDGTLYVLFKYKEKINYDSNKIKTICYDGIFNYSYIKLCIIPDLNLLYLYSNININTHEFTDVYIYELIKK